MSSATFGTEFAPVMTTTRFDGVSWTEVQLAPSDSLELHPATHALHYGSSCFEGLKAHRQPDGTVVAFRQARHVARLRSSAKGLCLPQPPTGLIDELLDQLIASAAELTPDPPGSLYLRPTLIGTDTSIGAAARPSNTALLYALACPVGDYLPAGELTIAVETSRPRTTPRFGRIKTGANYAMALATIERARTLHAADQVLFAADGFLQETGASNIVLLDEHELLTPALDDSFLHGVTRDSLLQLAPTLGIRVTERTITVDQLTEWISRPDAEVALVGTAAVLAPVGTVVVDGIRHTVGTASARHVVERLRDTLIAVQTGRTPLVLEGPRSGRVLR